MRRFVAVLVALFAITLLLAGCGGTTAAQTTVTSPGAAATAQAPATTAAPDTTAAPTTTEGAQSSYAEAVKNWWDKWQSKLKDQYGALEGLNDPLSMTDDQVKGIGKFAGVVSDAAKAFREIKPPASAATAHADYASMLQGMANGLERLQKALEDKTGLSGIMEALGALEATMKDSDGTVAALEQATGLKLGDAATNEQTGATTSTTGKSSDVGTKDNPVPVGTAQQVGDWAVTVVKYTPDATAAVLEANEFNDKPAAGETYVLVAVTAKYIGKESGTFWMDVSTKFLGKSGNTFDSPMASAPKPISAAGEAFPGASVSGNLLFQVPTDQATGGLLIVEPSFSFDEARAFFALR